MPHSRCGARAQRGEVGVDQRIGGSREGPTFSHRAGAFDRSSKGVSLPFPRLDARSVRRGRRAGRPSRACYPRPSADREAICAARPPTPSRSSTGSPRSRRRATSAPRRSDLEPLVLEHLEVELDRVGCPRAAAEPAAPRGLEAPVCHRNAATVIATLWLRSATPSRASHDLVEQQRAWRSPAPMPSGCGAGVGDSRDR